MQSPRIFIVSNHLLFSYGLKNLLYQEAWFDIVGQEADINKALDQIKELQPDVVILDDDDDSAPEIISILKASPGTDVVSLNLHNNNLRVYRTKQWVAKGVEDLVDAIMDRFPSFEPVALAKSVDKMEDGGVTETHTYLKK